MAEWGSAGASPTIQEVISNLRTSFTRVEFQNVANTLVEREDRLKEQCNELGKKAEASEKEKKVLFLENLKLNNELKKKQQEVDALIKENLEYKDQIRVLSSETCRVSKSALEDELKMKQREIEALRKLNAEYEEKEANQKQSTDLCDRVLKLEKTAKELMSSDGSSSFNLEHNQQKNFAAENSRPPLLNKKRDTKIQIEPKFQEIIKIDDDDDVRCSSTKRKRDSYEIKRDCSSDFVDNIQDSHSQPIVSNPHSTLHSSTITPHAEKIEPRNLISSLDNAVSICNPDIKYVDEAYKSLIALVKMKKHKWGSKDAMIEAFEKDDEFCMKAICALYRQSRSVLLLFDTSRITELGQLLTNGDPQKQLKKTASELDPYDVDDCRKFAKRYASLIFNIYQKKDDPFFP